MNNSSAVLLLGVAVLCVTSFGLARGEYRDEEAKEPHHLHRKAHQVDHAHRSSQEKQHYHHSRHHKGLKARDANSTKCISICDQELAAVAIWFNNTRELKLLFQLIPPSVKKAIFQTINGTFGNSSDLNSNTTFNGSISVNLDSLYDPNAEWPIFTYFAKLVGFFLSRTRGLTELFKVFPEFANIWKIILRGLTGGCGNPEVLLDNLRNLFGFNGTFGGNLFNLTYWEQLFSPARFIQGIEQAVEGGLGSFRNLTNVTG